MVLGSIIKTLQQKKLTMISTNFHAQQKPFIECCSPDISEDSSLQMSPILPSKYSLLNLKLSHSSAETCEEDISRKGSWQGQYSQRNSIEISEFLQDSSVTEQAQQLCEQFHQEGFCFKGRKCEKVHSTGKTYQQKQQRRTHIMKWILKETPELLIQELQGFDC